MVGSLKISNSADDVVVKSGNNEISSTKEPDSFSRPVSESIENGKSTTEVKPILTKNEPTPKEASEIDTKPTNPQETEFVAKEITNPNRRENDVSKNYVENESEANQAPTGAWGAKRSFIDVRIDFVTILHF